MVKWGLILNGLIDFFHFIHVRGNFKHCGNCHSYENVILFETFPWGASFLLSTYWKGNPPFSKDLWHLVWRKDMYCLLLWLLLQTGRGNFPQKSFLKKFCVAKLVTNRKFLWTLSGSYVIVINEKFAKMRTTSSSSFARVTYLPPFVIRDM